MNRPTFRVVPGFAGDAMVRDLPRSEIVKRHLPMRWHGEFVSDLRVRSQWIGEFNVPAGFLTDGASVPHPLWNVLSPNDPDILYPAYAHDLIYSLQGKLPKITLSIYEADEVIRELMGAINAPPWKREMVFHVLRAHNGSEWPELSAPKLASIKLDRLAMNELQQQTPERCRYGDHREYNYVPDSPHSPGTMVVCADCGHPVGAMFVPAWKIKQPPTTV